MTGISIRPMASDDVTAVVDLLRDSFAPDLRPFMTYTQRGIGAFLTVHMEHPAANPGRKLLVTIDTSTQQNVCAFAEFRIVSGTVGFLSYICVKKSARGRGIAKALIERFCELNPELTEMQLDVFHDNSPAISLYKKLGFERLGTVAWVTRPLPIAVGCAEVPGLPFAMASHQAYGFCEMLVNHQETEVRIGLIGRSVLRCFSADSFDDDSLLSGLAALFPQSTTAMAMLTAESVSDLVKSNQVILYSDRMTLSL